MPIRYESIRYRHKTVEKGHKMSEFACFSSRIKGNILMKDTWYYPDPPGGTLAFMFFTKRQAEK